MAPVGAQDAARLKAELRQEMLNLAQVLAEIEARRDATDDTTTYALALLLMNYYTGAERMFQRIAALFGGVPGAGDRWHMHLLEDMALDIPTIRPAVLLRSTLEPFGRLLRFRHLIRNLYAWVIRRTELEGLLAELPEAHAALDLDVSRFGTFLDSLIES